METQLERHYQNPITWTGRTHSSYAVHCHASMAPQEAHASLLKPCRTDCNMLAAPRTCVHGHCQQLSTRDKRHQPQRHSPTR